MSRTTRRHSEWRWPVRVAVAGAASVIVLVAYLSDLGARSEATRAGSHRVTATTQATATTDAPTSTGAAVTSPTTAKAPSPRTGAVYTRASSKGAPQARASADAAVLDWLDALGRGDVATAASLVGPKSRRYIESLGGNVEGLMTESQEGFGPWGHTPDRQSTEVELGVVDGAPATIVVVSGTPRGEGREGFSTDAFPAVRTAAGWVVEPTAFRSDTGGRLELVTPARASDGRLAAMRPSDAIAASAPGSGAFFFSLEDQPPVRVAGERAGGGVGATWDPPGELSAHRHLLVAAYADGDTLTAFAGTFDVR